MILNEKRSLPAFVRVCAAVVLMITLLAGIAAPAQAEILEWIFGSNEEESVPVLAGTEAPEVETEVNVPDSALEDDGMISVYLKSLGDPQKMHITLAGSYAVEGDGGFYFDRDARLAFSAVNGEVYMAVSGLTINMGPSVTLTRHLAEDGKENGIRIDESEKDALFCGDLRVSAENDMLKPVLTLHVEDYLYGVVAYEMSDSFPVEALKAQAVAARTYALQRKWVAGKKDYHLVDTTADQVYKGYIGDYANVIQAVDATRGVVGVYENSFATCYYTASNGGQTALASQIWGGTDSDGYLGMTEDPYDLENPSSLQNSITVSELCEGSAALKTMIMDGLSAEMKARGFTDGQWTFEAIEAIEPADYRFEGSLMCDSLAFTVRVRTGQPEPESEPEPTPANKGIWDAFVAFGGPDTKETDKEQAELPELSVSEENNAGQTGDSAVPEESAAILSVVVKLSVFDQIKDGLSLGMNGGDYELIAVETRTDEESGQVSFTIIMRRYGHGVGMSQRGAQQMAGQHGKTYMDILGFYYPGMSVERINWPERLLTPVRALPTEVGAARPKPTPTPTPAPLPALKAGEHYAKVALETKSSSLNVRENPGTSFRVVDKLSHGQRVIVSSEPDAEGWVAIHTAEFSGYVMQDYLEAE